MVLHKNFDLVVVACIVLALVMYDVTLDIVFSILHFVFEVFHNAFEWLELGIEHSVEHLFHTNRHGSQIVTFYILAALVLCAGWYLWKAMPAIYLTLKTVLLSTWARRKTQLQLYWQLMTPLHKFAVVVTALLVAYLASFFIM